MKRSEALEIVYNEIKNKIKDLEKWTIDSYDNPSEEQQKHELAIYRSIKKHVLDLMRNEDE